MGRQFDMNTFLMQGENLIDAELLCNEIDNFIDSYFEKKLTFKKFESKFSSDRYVYFCPPQKKGDSYVFEIGFGHYDEKKGFTNDEQNRFKEKLNNVSKQYSWKKHERLIVNKTWVCGRFDYDVGNMTLKKFDELATNVKKAFCDMKS